MSKPKMTKNLIIKTLTEEYGQSEAELKNLKLSDLEARLEAQYANDRAIAAAIDELHEKFGYDKAALADNTLEELQEMIAAENNKEPEAAPDVEEAPKTNEPFMSMCMSDFDPAPDGTCHMQCSQTHPDAFNACQTHYLQSLADSGRRRNGGKANGARQAAAPKHQSTPKADKIVNFLNHGIATQVHLIDTALLAGATIDEMADLCGTTKNRINSHLFTLRNKLGLTIIKEDKTKKLYLVLPEDRELVPEEWVLVPQKWHPASV